MTGTKRVFTLMVLGGGDNIHEGRVKPFMPKKSKGRDQPKCDPQGLQVGGWAEGDNPLL